MRAWLSCPVSVCRPANSSAPALVAQGIEHRSPKAGVARSIRAGGTPAGSPRRHGRPAPSEDSIPDPESGVVDQYRIGEDHPDSIPDHHPRVVNGYPPRINSEAAP